MVNPFTLTLQASDLLGIQNAYLFLILALTTGPIFLFLGFLRDPTILFSLKRAKNAAFSGMWKHISGPIDARYARFKAPLLKEASGVVLDLGSGLGPNLKYFDASKITRLILVEPNPGMHEGLRASALKAGFAKDQFEIVPCGAEERARVEELTGLGKESVDCVVSVLALCGIPDSRHVIAALYDYIKPGGRFIYFEHVASKDSATRKQQEIMTPYWKSLFNGCCLNRPTDLYILECYPWADKKTFTIDFETQKCLDVKSYGWARKPSTGVSSTAGGPSYADVVKES